MGAARPFRQAGEMWSVENSESLAQPWPREAEIR
jgi:hypothetical protein